jgi:hypothetical protein
MGWFKTPDTLLSENKAGIKQRIDSIRDQKLRGGYVNYDGHGYDTRAESLQRMTGLTLKALMDADFTSPWVTQENVTVMLTAPDIFAVGNLMAEREAAFVFYARQLKDAVFASDDPDLIDIEARWPDGPG